MRRLRTLMFTACLVLLLTGSGVWAVDGPYLLVRVAVDSEYQVRPLQEMGLDIVGGVRNESVELICFPEELARIRSLGYYAEVLIEDMEQHYAAQYEGDSMGPYHTYDEAVAHMDSIHALYPNITTAKFSIGQSIQGREQWVIKVSDNPTMDEDEPEVLFDGLTHAREPIGLETCLTLLNQLCAGYGSNPTITNLVNNREIFLLPVVNPDGYVYNQQTNPNGGGMWRKNRRLNAGGSYGVDLNRNFGFNWGYNNIGSSPTPSSDTYRGTAPFSEPETQNLRQFCNGRNLAIAWNIHSYGGYIIYPWSIPAAPWGLCPDNAALNAMGAYMEQNWLTGYEVGTSWQVLYEVNGDACDWMYGEQGEKPKIMPYTPEIGASFWPVASAVPGLLNQAVPAAFYMIEQAANYVPMPVSLAYQGSVISDPPPGNNNGGLDPGESVTLTPTLRNNGWVNATGISAQLICSDPYLTITTGTAAFPNLNAHAQAASSTPYALSVSPACPLEHSVTFGLLWTCAQSYSDTAFFTLIVGDPLYQPMGPDAYGYYAYDIYDENGPVFDWIEISPRLGGPGTTLNYTQDDQTFPVNLPFTFRYYGQDFTQISVCGNGWIAMGSTTSTDYSNSAIPDSDGPPNMIAPFWEDLTPLASNGSTVAYHYNAAQHYFVVEFDSVREYTPNTSRETFEVVLYDPAYYPTQTGDGKILFQYKRTDDLTSNTVGIENGTQTVGLQVLYNGNLNSHMAPVAPERAILFTTATSVPDVQVTLTPIGAPIQIPATGGAFSYNASLVNQGSSPSTFNAWIGQWIPAGTWQGPLLGPLSLTLPTGANVTRQRNQYVPGTAAPGTYTYVGYVGLYSSGVKWDSSSFTYTKLTTGDGPWVENWNNDGESFAPYLAGAESPALPQSCTLSQNYPNPFNPLTTIGYSLPQAGFVSLKVYDLQGRTVAVLADGYRPAGAHQVAWDAAEMASGVYLYVLKAGEATLSGKMVLLK